MIRGGECGHLMPVPRVFEEKVLHFLCDLSSANPDGKDKPKIIENRPGSDSVGLLRQGRRDLPAAVRADDPTRGQAS